MYVRYVNNVFLTFVSAVWDWSRHYENLLESWYGGMGMGGGAERGIFLN